MALFHSPFLHFDIKHYNTALTLGIIEITEDAKNICETHRTVKGILTF